MNNAAIAIMKYGIHLVHEYFPLEKKPDNSLNQIFEKYEDILAGNQENEKNLSWILSKVKLSNNIDIKQKYIIPSTLGFDVSSFSFIQTESKEHVSFDNNIYLNLVRFNTDKEFTKFYYSFLRFAWSLPCALGINGVSLFDQWKIVAAMVFATGEKWENGPENEYCLVGSDIPGIQEFVYTITSKGAAKGLRGRSYFIHLLSDAIIRRLLKEWELEETNIIYEAGGNFMILAPSDIQINPLKEEFEDIILEYFHGDLGLCLEEQNIKSFELGTNQFSEKTKLLKEKIAQQKRKKFSSLAHIKWDSIFSPQGKPGNQYCVICQSSLGQDEGKPLHDDIGNSGEKKCSVCETLENLANEIKGGKYENLHQENATDLELWQKVLFRISGYVYSYKNDIDHPLKGSITLAINNPEFDSTKADGFKFIANTTPEVSQIDIEQWEESEKQNGNKPKIGDIRTFSQMASAARGIKKLGVLRMDVDNLGKVMILGLDIRNVLSISCISRALNWFFRGRLNSICEDINRQEILLPGNGKVSNNDLRDRLYTIYAGGDDLFIVGSWNLMPELANKIRSEFTDYCCHNPSLTISAGIVLKPDKYPLYQAANDAGIAEESSKSFLLGDGSKKNAFTFLGQTFPWSMFRTVETAKNVIVEIALEENKAITQIIQNIHQQYLDELEKQTPLGDNRNILPMGPWRWRSVYALTRLAERINSNKVETKKKVIKIRENILKQPDTYGLAARWAELTIRKDENDGEQ